MVTECCSGVNRAKGYSVPEGLILQNTKSQILDENLAHIFSGCCIDFRSETSKSRQLLILNTIIVNEKTAAFVLIYLDR